MATVHVVCDASFDDQLLLAGYAGHIYINPSQQAVSAHSFSGVIGECADVHQAEIFAITSGLLALKEVADNSRVSISHVAVHTDSITAIQEWTAAQQGYRKHPAYTQIIDSGLHFYQQNHWQVTFNHVHSHVPNEIATPIEKLHNLADKHAKIVREKAAKHLLQPDIKGSPYYTILLPATSKNQQEADLWYRIAQTLCEKQKQGRIWIQGDKSQHAHPFLSGINDYADSHHLNRLQLGKQYLYLPQQTINGLDITLARRWLSQQDMGFTMNFEPQHLHQVALASRLLMGDADTGFFHHHCDTGRFQPASAVVYDLTGLGDGHYYTPETAAEWVNTLADMIDIPQIANVDNVMKALDMAPSQPHTPHDDIDHVLTAHLKAIYDDYAGKIERSQWTLMMAKAINQHLNIKNTVLKDAVLRYLSVCEESQPERLIEQTLKHIRKIAPPSEPLTPPQAQHDHVMPPPRRSRH